jgi:hypothetical protein
MFGFDRSVSPWIGLEWLVATAVVAFLVTWLATDILRVKRTPYVALLSIVTGGLASGFLASSRAGTSFWIGSWKWAILGGVLTSGAMLVFARRLPRANRPSGGFRLALWEGAVYGAAEGLLLSVLPVAITWQALRSFGWTSGFAETGAAVLAVLASVGVIVVHHLGYWEFRSSLMRFPVILCSLLSVGYLLTANPIAPIVGHIMLHLAMIRKGVELPPHVHLKETLVTPASGRLATKASVGA